MHTHSFCRVLLLQDLTVRKAIDEERKACQIKKKPKA